MYPILLGTLRPVCLRPRRHNSSSVTAAKLRPQILYFFAQRQDHIPLFQDYAHQFFSCKALELFHAGTFYTPGADTNAKKFFAALAR